MSIVQNPVTGREVTGTTPTGGLIGGVIAAPWEDVWEWAAELVPQAVTNAPVNERTRWAMAWEIDDTFTTKDLAESTWLWRSELVTQATADDNWNDQWFWAARPLELIVDLAVTEWLGAWEIDDTFRFVDLAETSWRTIWRTIDAYEVYTPDDPLTPPDELVVVLNGQTGAPVEWTGLNVRGFITVRGELYAMTDAGVFRFGAADDAGQPIAARVRTGQTDFGVDRLKRFDSVRIAGQTGDRFTMKVRDTGAGRMREYDYISLPAKSDAMRTQIVKPGRGVKFTYVELEFGNRAGSEMRIDQAEVYPVIIGRRR